MLHHTARTNGPLGGDTARNSIERPVNSGDWHLCCVDKQCASSVVFFPAINFRIKLNYLSTTIGQAYRRNKDIEMPVTRVERTLTMEFPAVSPPKGPLLPRVGGRGQAVPGQRPCGRPDSAGAAAEPIACHGEHYYVLGIYYGDFAQLRVHFDSPLFVEIDRHQI